MSCKIVVVGVGNELRGDDAVGVIAARRLASCDLGEGVEVIEGHTGGINLLFDIEGADWVIIIDAVDFGAQPGSVEIFEADEVDIRVIDRVASLHHVSLADVIQLAQLTGVAPRITLVAVQPQTIAPGQGLSDPVAKQVDAVVRSVAELVLAANSQHCNQQGGGP